MLSRAVENFSPEISEQARKSRPTLTIVGIHYFRKFDLKIEQNTSPEVKAPESPLH